MKQLQMADPERQRRRAALRSLLADRVPEEAAKSFTDEQIDALLAAGYCNETFLAGLQLEDLPDPPFLPAVRSQAGKVHLSRMLTGCVPVKPALKPASGTPEESWHV